MPEVPQVEYDLAYVIFVFFKRNALLNTEIELIAIAAPATTGLSNPNAASGMPKTL